MNDLNDFILNVFSNLLANLLFWMVGGILIIGIINIRKRQLYRFFGITARRTLLIYMSTHLIENKIFKHRSEIENKVDTELISRSELQAVPLFTQLFSPKLLEHIPDILAGLVDSYWVLSRPNIHFTPSPLAEANIKFENTICIGSNRFNTATEYYLRTCNPHFIFDRITIQDRGTTVIKINRGGQTGEIIKRKKEEADNERDWDLGIVVKLFDSEHGNTIFVTGGIGEMGTLAAAEYLVQNWKFLRRTYKDTEFGICLRCPSFAKDPEGYKNQEVVKYLPDPNKR